LTHNFNACTLTHGRAAPRRGARVGCVEKRWRGIATNHAGMGDGSNTRTTPLVDWFPKKWQRFLCGMIWHLDFM